MEGVMALILDPQKSDKFRRAIYEQNKRRAQSFSNRGYSKDRELMHCLRIPRRWLLTDPDLLMAQRCEYDGDGKGVDRYTKRFLDRHPECDLQRILKRG
ncbi:MAG: hypothetical protein WC406_10365 [Methanoregula sp.]|jgi:hypothetical protein